MISKESSSSVAEKFAQVQKIRHRYQTFYPQNMLRRRIKKIGQIISISLLKHEKIIQIVDWQVLFYFLYDFQQELFTQSSLVMQGFLRVLVKYTQYASDLTKQNLLIVMGKCHSIISRSNNDALKYLFLKLQLLIRRVHILNDSYLLKCLSEINTSIPDQYFRLIQIMVELNEVEVKGNEIYLERIQQKVAHLARQSVLESSKFQDKTQRGGTPLAYIIKSILRAGFNDNQLHKHFASILFKQNFISRFVTLAIDFEDLEAVISVIWYLVTDRHNYPILASMLNSIIELYSFHLQSFQIGKLLDENPQFCEYWARIILGSQLYEKIQDLLTSLPTSIIFHKLALTINFSGREFIKMIEQTGYINHMFNYANEEELIELSSELLKANINEYSDFRMEYMGFLNP